MKKSSIFLFLVVLIVGVFLISEVSAECENTICDASPTGTVGYDTYSCSGDSVIHNWREATGNYCGPTRNGVSCNGGYYYWDYETEVVEDCSISGLTCSNGACIESSCLTGEEFMTQTGKRQDCSGSQWNLNGQEYLASSCLNGCRYDNLYYDLYVSNDGNSLCRANGVADDGVEDLINCPIATQIQECTNYGSSTINESPFTGSSAFEYNSNTCNENQILDYSDGWTGLIHSYTTVQPDEKVPIVTRGCVEIDFSQVVNNVGQINITSKAVNEICGCDCNKKCGGSPDYTPPEPLCSYENPLGHIFFWQDGNWSYKSSFNSQTSEITSALVGDFGSTDKVLVCRNAGGNHRKNLAVKNLQLFESLPDACLTSFWSPLNSETKINEANLGDTVLMRHGGSNLSGQMIDYNIQIFNSTDFIWWNPSTWFNSLNWNSAGKINGLSYEPFVINNAKVNDILRFNSSVNNSIVSTLSNDLTITAEDNSVPSAMINLPNQGSIFAANSTIEFTQTSFDEDDLLQVTWNFGDGESEVFEDYSFSIDSASADTTHTYSQNGAYTIQLKVEDYRNSGSKNGIDTRQIVILEKGINVISIISSPENLQIFGNSIVHFDISQSYVANCSDFGTMPNADFDTTDELLSCVYLVAPGSQSTGENQRIQVDWVLNDGRGNTLSGDWDVNYSEVVVFNWPYSGGGQRTADLNMAYYYTI